MPTTRSSRGTRAGLALLSFGTVAAACAYGGVLIAGTAPAWAAWALAVGSAAASVSLFVLGAAARGALSRGISTLLVMLFLVLVAAFGSALAMPPAEGPGAQLVFGLPIRLAIVFYGVGFVPLVALPLAFGLTFDANDGSPASRPGGT